MTEITEIPESPMRFFTPDLFLRVNSEEEEVADNAYRDWETATDAYRHNLKKVLRYAPRPVVDLSIACFHDAVVGRIMFDSLGRESGPYLPGPRIPPSVSRPSPFTIQLTLEKRSIGLVYLVWDAVIPHPPIPGWPDTVGNTLWLYDEIDEIWSKFGMFIHRILLSNGEVWEIPFYDVMHIETPNRDRRRLNP